MPKWDPGKMVGHYISHEFSLNPQTLENLHVNKLLNIKPFNNLSIGKLNIRKLIDQRS